MPDNLIITSIPRSHRKRDKIENILGFRPKTYYSMRRENNFMILNQADFDKVKHSGVTKARIKREDIHPCWYMDKKYAPTQPY